MKMFLLDFICASRGWFKMEIKGWNKQWLANYKNIEGYSFLNLDNIIFNFYICFTVSKSYYFSNKFFLLCFQLMVGSYASRLHGIVKCAEIVNEVGNPMLWILALKHIEINWEVNTDEVNKQLKGMNNRSYRKAILKAGNI